MHLHVSSAPALTLLRVWAQFHLTSLVVMDAFGHAVVVGWLIHEEKSAEALACGLTAWLRAVTGVMPGFRPASFFSDDDPAEHKAIRCGAAAHVSD